MASAFAATHGADAQGRRHRELVLSLLAITTRARGFQALWVSFTGRKLSAVDWTALTLSLKLALVTTAVLLPVGILLARFFAWKQFKAKSLLEALCALPLVLPPTVLGYYLLVSMGGNSVMGKFFESIFGHSLVFSFSGLLIASIIFNLPFAIQPMPMNMVR